MDEPGSHAFLATKSALQNNDICLSDPPVFESEVGICSESSWFKSIEDIIGPSNPQVFESEVSICAEGTEFNCVDAVEKTSTLCPTEVDEVVKTPVASQSSKYVKKAIAGAFWTLTAYGIYKVLQKTGVSTLIPRTLPHSK